MFKRMRSNLELAIKTDPASKNKWIVALTYPGFHALCFHSIAHFFYKIKLTFIARVISQFSRFITGIEIHPAVVMGYGIFIDHGMGVVIGETTELGSNIVIYQGVTLGGTGKETGKRHPTIKNNVTLCAGAKVLGAITIGENSKIGAQAVVLKDVPPNTTVVGIPAKVVIQNGEKIDCSGEIDTLKKELNSLKNELKLIKEQLNKTQN